MSTEVESQESNDQVQDALMAGFNKVRGEELPAEDPPKETSATTEQPVATTATTEESEPAPAADTTATATATDDEAAEKTAPVAEDDPIVPGIGLKASEVKKLLARAATFDQAAIEEKVSQRMFGKFGEMQRSLNELKKQKTEQPAPGQTVKLTGDKLKRLSEEYPDLANAIAEDLSEVLQAPAGTFTKDEVEAIVTERVTQKSKEHELKLLTVAHPDWYEHRHAPEFDIWLSMLPTEAADKVRTSEDSVFLTKAFTAHKAWKNAAIEAQRAAEEAATAATKQKNEKRLEGGLTPTGVTPPAPPPPTAASAMEAGFKRVRGR